MVLMKHGHRRLMRFAAALALPAAILTAGTLPAAAQRDPVQAAFNAAFADPTNIPLQLAYARAVEASGKYEAAFPVYERVLALDPNNREAKEGLRRVRAIIQPAKRETFVEFGGNWESNPLHLTPGSPEDSEFQLYGNLAGKYENTYGGQRWRTETRLSGIWHAEQDFLNYGYAGAITGPMLDIAANSVLHVAAGAGIASFSGRLFYTEVLGSLTAESGYGGAQQTLRLRAAWRHYDSFWVSDSGYWADITGKFIMPQTRPGSAFILTPWARISDVAGSFLSVDPLDNNIPFTLQPGAYIETGGQLQYVHEVRRNLTAAVSLAANVRQYSVDVVPLTTTARRDVTLTPGISVVLANVAKTPVDLRFRYNYVWNNSNDNFHDFRTHIVTVGLGGKF